MPVEARAGISCSSHQPNAAEVAVTGLDHDNSPWETCLLQAQELFCQGLLTALNLDTSLLLGRNTLLKWPLPDPQDSLSLAPCFPIRATDLSSGPLRSVHCSGFCPSHHCPSFSLASPSPDHPTLPFSMLLVLLSS